MLGQLVVRGSNAADDGTFEGLLFVNLRESVKLWRPWSSFANLLSQGGLLKEQPDWFFYFPCKLYIANTVLCIAHTHLLPPFFSDCLILADGTDRLP
jgi:hypothetical protein